MRVCADFVVAVARGFTPRAPQSIFTKKKGHAG